MRKSHSVFSNTQRPTRVQVHSVKNAYSQVVATKRPMSIMGMTMAMPMAVIFMAMATMSMATMSVISVTVTVGLLRPRAVE